MTTSRSGHLPQRIQFCRAPDGVRIAYAVHGAGPPLLVSTCWLSHLQFDWESPVWHHFLADLGRFATIIRYDERGHGLSDWDVQDHSLEARIGDLEAVADAAGFDRFALMAMAQGGPVAISYATRHAERVDRLLFYGSYSWAGYGMTAEDLETEDTFGQMIKVGWARPDSVFRRVFTTLMIPDASEEQMRWLDDLQRVAVSASVLYQARQQRSQADAGPLLGDLDVPTLILHSTGDQMNPFMMARYLASSIAGARLVALNSNNHILLEDEPAWPIFVDEVQHFLHVDAAVPSPRVQVEDVLSDRELGVLRLAAAGLDNAAIAADLTLSVRTVERHLQNVYAKLGVQGRSARIAAARLLA
ncbi:MAG: transcriptional regulator, LuxR family [Pseudonocardiales bacterium]|nr:transcriptional regulator, LuxR family [Pseudonocardiales bacterium]